MRDDDDDGYGQVDGDAASPFIPPGQPGSPFASSFGAVPWARSGLPPWHMWGTIETVSTIATVLALPALPTGLSKQLTKVTYRRPDTWQWLLYARLLSAPDGGGVGNFAEVDVVFDVTIGVGRASVTLPIFERFGWTWTGAPQTTELDVKWSTSAIQPQRISGVLPAADHSIAQLVAQDIQVSARYAAAGPNPLTATPYVIEIGSFFAPRSHVRPDWLLPNAQNQPLEAKFPGDEIGGR